MGGFGSGPQYAGKTTMEQCGIGLRIGWLNRNGYLVRGQSKTVFWPQDLEDRRSILTAPGARLTLQDGLPDGHDYLRIEPVVTVEQKPVGTVQGVGIEWQSCRFGGRRPYFFCPSCGRRVLALPYYGERFACRQCHGLAYCSQQIDFQSRMERKANRLRAKLRDPEAGLGDTPDRPNGMHWRTYERTVRAMWKAEELADEAATDRTLRILAGIMAHR